MDTSAWVELLRKSGHPVAQTLKALLGQRADLAVTEVVLMEVLAGAPSGSPLVEVRSQLVGLPILRLEGLADFEEAARIYRSCRDAGHTVRNQLDCLIAVPTIRHGASLLHNDRDFETIARHSRLELQLVAGRDSPDGTPELRELKGTWRREAGRARGARHGRARPARRDPARTTAR